MEKIITAFILGMSPERILLCPFLTFGMALSEKGAAVRFLLGRFAGLVVLGFLFTLIGLKSFPLSHRAVDLIFGIVVIFMAVGVFFKKPGSGSSKCSQHSGFGLGIVRGMLNPGRKIVLLFPLLIGVNVAQGLLITITYAFSSSIYLILGLIGGEFLDRVFSHRRQIKVAGAVILIVLGLFYIAKGLGLFCILRGVLR